MWIGRFFCLDDSELRPTEPSSSRMEGGWWEMVPDTSTHGGCPLKHFTGNSRLLASWRGCLWSLVALLQIWWTPAADARPAPRWRPRYRTWWFRQRQNWLATAISFNVKQTASDKSMRKTCVITASVCSAVYSHKACNNWFWSSSICLIILTINQVIG